VISLKSVAHLPVRVFIYRACNTFIDDLFAFVISMPTMHRLACFRDDIIFFIYLYQRWIYPVDHSRTIQLDDDGDEVEGERKASQGRVSTDSDSSSGKAACSTNPAATAVTPDSLVDPDSSSSVELPSPSDSILTRRHPVNGGQHGVARD
jgi:hypothetical protein